MSIRSIEDLAAKFLHGRRGTRALTRTLQETAIKIIDFFLVVKTKLKNDKKTYRTFLRSFFDTVGTTTQLQMVTRVVQILKEDEDLVNFFSAFLSPVYTIALNNNGYYEIRSGRRRTTFVKAVRN